MRPQPSEATQIPIEQITAGENVRTELGDLTELESTIAEHGIIVPLGVRKLGENSYALEYGFRRLACALRLGLRTVPVVLVPDASNPIVVNVIENLQRKDLTALEEAAGLQQLQLSLELSSDQVGSMIGKSGTHVRDRLSLLTAHDAVKEALRNGVVSVSAATELVKLPVEEQPSWIARAKRQSARALKADIEFRLMPPAARELLGAGELARRAGREEQVQLPTIAEDMDDPRLVMAVEYAQRVKDHVTAIQELWPQLTTRIRSEVLDVLVGARQQMATLEVGELAEAERGNRGRFLPGV